MKFRPKTLFSLFYVLFFAAIIVVSLDYNHKARLIPLVVSIPCLVFSVVQLSLELLGKGKKKGRSIEDDLFHGIMGTVHVDVPVDGAAPEKKKRERSLKPFFKILGWILAFYACVFLFGFMITIPLYTVVFMKLHKERWFTAGACALGTWVVIYVAFSVIAKITLHEGLVFTLLSSQ